MPKETFLNLPPEKQGLVCKVLKEEFETNPFYNVSVKSIVDKVGISRGSFYQYFEDLKNAYYLTLELYTVEPHELFLQVIKECRGDLELTFEKYGEKLAEVLFDEDNYNLYKNKYLHWNRELESGYDSYLMEKNSSSGRWTLEKLEKVHFLNAVLHSLLERVYIEGWTKEEFLEKYKMHMEWLKAGL